MNKTISFLSLILDSLDSHHPIPAKISLPSFCNSSSFTCYSGIKLKHSPLHPVLTAISRPQLHSLVFSSSSFMNHIEYKFPDPIPEFGQVETEKFRAHFLDKLSKKKDRYGDLVEEVVGICTEIPQCLSHDMIARIDEVVRAHDTVSKPLLHAHHV